MRKYNVAIVGATGAVGQEMLSILSDSDFPIEHIKLLASDKSLGSSLYYKNDELPVDVLDSDKFDGIDICFFAAGQHISLEFAEKAAKGGSVVIDLSGVFDDKPDIPLVVSGVNSEDIGNYNNNGIIASPSCTAALSSIVLQAIEKRYGLKRVVISTYQSVSEIGIAAADELMRQTEAWFEFKYDKAQSNIINKKIAFNCVPFVGDAGYANSTKEEDRAVSNLKRLLNLTGVGLNITCVLTPVFRGHAQSLNVETQEPIEIKNIAGLLNSINGCKVVDNIKKLEYSTAIDIVGKDELYVSRIKKDSFLDNSFNAWIVSDNLRKGSALNAVEIAKILIKDYL